MRSGGHPNKRKIEADPLLLSRILKEMTASKGLAVKRAALDLLKIPLLREKPATTEGLRLPTTSLLSFPGPYPRPLNKEAGKVSLTGIIFSIRLHVWTVAVPVLFYNLDRLSEGQTKAVIPFIRHGVISSFVIFVCVSVARSG